MRFIRQGVTKDNYREVLVPLLTAGGGQGFCVNLSVDTWLGRHHDHVPRIGALYIDTVTSPGSASISTSKGPEKRSNYALREALLAAKKARPGGLDNAVSTCGANPGMVSWFVKQALLDVAARSEAQCPKSRRPKANGAGSTDKLGVKGIHIAERDTQRSKTPKATNVFVNTWSVEGFVSEGVQPAELGWGTHEKWMPRQCAAPTNHGCGAAIYLMQPGANTRVRSWCPTRGAQYGFLVTHNESISIADYFTVRDASARWSIGRPATTPIIRPTTRCCRCMRCSARSEDAGKAAHPR